ncbi:hypothetical protein [Amycolatopsis sp. cmx-4-61]|uniref:hypothetical protein n=1 Tax=Amycolatopsis sp. cmx-4-61 TaxID=2790937 RepID=UPI00397A3CF7
MTTPQTSPRDERSDEVRNEKSGPDTDGEESELDEETYDETSGENDSEEDSSQEDGPQSLLEKRFVAAAMKITGMKITGIQLTAKSNDSAPAVVTQTVTMCNPEVISAFTGKIGVTRDLLWDNTGMGPESKLTEVVHPIQLTGCFADIEPTTSTNARFPGEAGQNSDEHGVIPSIVQTDGKYEADQLFLQFHKGDVVGVVPNSGFRVTRESFSEEVNGVSQRKLRVKVEPVAVSLTYEGKTWNAAPGGGESIIETVDVPPAPSSAGL